ncbi:unnamed protein product [Rangifer tarandus platyrhynchus]|uniref:Uncharacterized protein n=1 Tax=Rangifer tarandus platyrhynchus TaxID=3082113 RepID=A0ABN8YXZ9_RANTA|nr:unnamed protein product [Rangifer tarandus platyrhynchus]
MVGGPPTARIPPLTSAIMRALTGIDLQNDGPTIGRRCPPNFAGDKQMGSENRAFEPIRSRTIPYMEKQPIQIPAASASGGGSGAFAKPEGQRRGPAPATVIAGPLRPADLFQGCGQRRSAQLSPPPQPPPRQGREAHAP